MRGPKTWTTLLVSFYTNAWVPSPTVKSSRCCISSFQRSSSSFLPSMSKSLLSAGHHRHSNPSIQTVTREQLSLTRHVSTKAARRTTQYMSSTYSGDERNSDADADADADPSFEVGGKIQVEVVSFGPLGASVGVVGIGHGENVNLLPVDAEPYATGLIIQQEIAYFRQARGNVDVVRGEILPAFVQNVREEDGKLDICLRVFGGKAKADEVSTMILERLQASSDGTLPVGDKSSPAEINHEFPGVSKAVFKKAVGALYKTGQVAPSPKSITLTQKSKR